MRVERAQVVKAPVEQVFAAWNDCEAWPVWSTTFTRVTIAERAGNTRRVDAELKVGEHTVQRTETHVLTPPALVEVDGEMAGATNTTAWKFEAVADGTVLTAVLEAPLTEWTKLFGPSAESQVGALLGEEMKAFAHYVESRQ